MSLSHKNVDITVDLLSLDRARLSYNPNSIGTSGLLLFLSYVDRLLEGFGNFSTAVQMQHLHCLLRIFFERESRMFHRKLELTHKMGKILVAFIIHHHFMPDVP